MFSSEIHGMLNRDKYAKKTFIGVYSCNELKTIKTRKKLYGLVVNTDKSWEPGTHWQSIFVKNNKCHFFCSLGLKPNTDVLQYLSKFPKYYCNRQKQQRFSERTCGAYAIFIQAMMSRGHSFKFLCEFFDNLKNDDEFMQNYLKETFNFAINQ